MSRPKGSKNKVSRQSRQVRYVIGSGKQFTFPIVRDGNVNGKIAELVVGSETFGEALHAAVKWALEYSTKQNETRSGNDEDLWFYPLVKRATAVIREKLFVKRVDCNHAYAENRDYGCWLPILVLGEI